MRFALRARGQPANGAALSFILTTRSTHACNIQSDSAAQGVLRVTPRPDHATPFNLTRAASHLGIGHVAIELNPIT